MNYEYRSKIQASISNYHAKNITANSLGPRSRKFAEVP